MKLYISYIALFGAAAYAQGPTSVHPALNTQAYGTSNVNVFAYPTNNANMMPSNNRYQTNTASNSNGYQSNANSYMLPMMMGTDKGSQMAAMGMMMNSRQGNNILPFYMMNQGYEKLLPMMAFMNRGNQGGQRMNPLMMMTLHEVMN